MKLLKKRFSLPSDCALHSRHIRRWEGAFCSFDSEQRREFQQAITDLVRSLRIRVYSVVVDKRRLAERFIVPMNPYDVSMSQLLSLVCGPPGTPSTWRPNVAGIVAERRGTLEDRQLQGEYQAFRKSGLASYGAKGVIQGRSSTVQRVFPTRIRFLPKRPPIAGLELADLCAYPIGRAVIAKSTTIGAYPVVATKLRHLIVFP